MATASPSIISPEIPSGFGRHPYAAIPVDHRPASFADALERYRQAKAVEMAVELGSRQGVIRSDAWCDAAVNSTMMAFDRLMAAPPPTIGALADKIATVLAEYQEPDGRGFMQADEAAVILADARLLGQRL